MYKIFETEIKDKNCFSNSNVIFDSRLKKGEANHKIFAIRTRCHAQSGIRPRSTY